MTISDIVPVSLYLLFVQLSAKFGGFEKKYERHVLHMHATAFPKT